ncbi:mediator of RNA polymerase II transcription subunit 26 isoform X2 [Bacillus rossius redtenbacheri]
MPAVVEIITILERTPITKEALETTRLGKYVNDLRRKTTNEFLAKRAKDLVRRWRDMIQNHAGSSAAAAMSPQTNGASLAGRALSPGLVPRGSPISSSGRGTRSAAVSPATSSEKSTSPGLQSSQLSSASARLSKTVRRVPPESHAPAHARAGLAPVCDPVPKTHAENKRLRKESPTSDGAPPRKMPRPNGQLNVLDKKGLVNTQLDFLGECSRDSFGVDSDPGSNSCEIIATFDKVPEVSVEQTLPKKRGRKKGSTKASAASRNTPSVSVPSVGDDDVKEKIASVARTPKVKTTQELLAGLRAKTCSVPVAEGAVPLSDSKTSLTNCMFSDQSISRYDDVSRNKTEHIAKFLQSQSEVETIDDESSSVEILPCETVDVGCNSKVSAIVEDDDKDVSLGSKKTTSSRPFAQSSSSLPDKESSAVIREEQETLEEIMARLPPLNVDEIDWDDSELDEGRVDDVNRIVTDDQVDRLHSEHLEGVNGTIHNGVLREDDDDRFREWHEMVSKVSYRGDLLHILPYVVID